ncbi:MAG: hypothetical protein KAX39_08670 [candidate division Zixibacteria bacterium]|nr:hypothetical protein [candidate division Zixibacteria bacterium]
MKKLDWIFAVAILVFLAAPCSTPQVEEVDKPTKENKLAEWRKGVWLLSDGSYAIYTDTHYFVVMVSGDTSSPNIYCGASQIQFHRKGMARKQVIRVRQLPGGELNLHKVNVLGHNAEIPLKIDTTQFAPNTCNIKDGIIYDSITEVTDEYILLTTCNGDHEKIFSNGVCAYLPAGGGEFYSIRIESF